MIRFFFSAMVLLVFMASCGNADNSNKDSNSTATDNSSHFENEAPKGTPVSIKGKVQGMAADSKAFLDKKTFEARDVVTYVPINADGSFEIKTAIEHPGIFCLRLGPNYIWLVLEGNENIDLTATVEGTELKSYQINGSPQSAEMLNVIERIKRPEELARYISSKKEDQVLVNLLMVERLDMQSFVDQYSQVKDQLVSKYPNWQYTRDFNAKVSQLVAQLNAQPLAEGKPVPDIRLKDPEGKEIALSSLKGKVVLLDFWASWCGPCRRENPNVVSIYKKYKDRGFTVYSVSLDGLNDQQVAMMQGNASQLNSQMEAQKQRWVAAIKEDNLIWPYHVSELRSWSTQVAIQFGVSSIPKAFLIDKNGIVRYIDGLRGPELEEKVKKLLG